MFGKNPGSCASGNGFTSNALQRSYYLNNLNALSRFWEHNLKIQPKSNNGMKLLCSYFPNQQYWKRNLVMKSKLRGQAEARTSTRSKTECWEWGLEMRWAHSVLWMSCFFTNYLVFKCTWLIHSFSPSHTANNTECSNRRSAVEIQKWVLYKIWRLCSGTERAAPPFTLAHPHSNSSCLVTVTFPGPLGGVKTGSTENHPCSGFCFTFTLHSLEI